MLTDGHGKLEASRIEHFITLWEKAAGQPFM